MMKIVMRLHILPREYQKHGSEGRRRTLLPRKTKKANLSKMKSSASNAKNQDMSDQNVLG